jgi:nicotinamidase-related amidase
MKPALLVIDLQNAFCRGESASQMAVAAEYINAALPLFREKKLPVVWIQHMDEEDGVVPGSPGFDFIPALKPLEGEFRIYKRYGNSFNKTDLHGILQAQGVDTVIVSGYCAEYCVVSTLVGALDLEYSPILYRGGIASGNAENRLAVERAYDVVTYGALKKFLENA